MSRDNSRSARGRLAAAIAAVIGISAFVVSCDESLPPRDEPRNFLKATLSARGGGVGVDSAGTIIGAGWLELTVENLLNEVLQAEANVDVRVRIQVLEAPSVQVSVSLRADDLVNRWIVQGGQVTLRPDSAAMFYKQWSHRTDAGQPLWELVRLTRQSTPGGLEFCESDSVHLVATATAQLFKNTGPVTTSRVNFTLIYRVLGIVCN